MNVSVNTTNINISVLLDRATQEVSVEISNGIIVPVPGEDSPESISIISTSFGDTGNAGVDETIIASHVFDGDKLINGGDWVRAEFFGHFIGGTTPAGVIKVNFKNNSVTLNGMIENIGANIVNPGQGAWKSIVTIMRIDQFNVKMFTELFMHLNTSRFYIKHIDDNTMDLSQISEIEVTGTHSGGTNDKIVHEFSKLYYSL